VTLTAVVETPQPQLTSDNHAADDQASRTQVTPADTISPPRAD